jgi:Flp pilus assembly protein TadD
MVSTNARLRNHSRAPISGLLCLVAGLLVACGGQPVKEPIPVESASAIQVDVALEKKFDQAVIALNAGNYDTAINLLTELIKSEPRLVAPYVNLGMAYARKGDNKHAEEYLRKAVDIDLGHPVANNELGMLYRKLGRFDDARHAYTNALAKNPEYLPAIRNLGILCDIYLRDMECALQQYERYLEYVPDDKTVSIWVADIKRRAGQ